MTKGSGAAMKEEIGVMLETLLEQGTQDERALRHRGGREVSTRSDERLNELAVLMAQMQAAYPSIELLPDTAEIWIALWIEMAEEHGIELFRMALWRACRTRVLPVAGGDRSRGAEDEGGGA